MTHFMATVYQKTKVIFHLSKGRNKVDIQDIFGQQQAVV